MADPSILSLYSSHMAHTAGVYPSFVTRGITTPPEQDACPLHGYPLPFIRLLLGEEALQEVSLLPNYNTLTDQSLEPRPLDTKFSALTISTRLLHSLPIRSNHFFSNNNCISMNSSLAVCVGSIQLSEYFRENICRKLDPFTALVTDHSIVLSWWAGR